MKFRNMTVMVLLLSLCQCTTINAQEEKKAIEKLINFVLEKDSDARWTMSAYVGNSVKIDEIETTYEEGVYEISGSFKFTTLGGAFVGIIDPYYAKVRITSKSVEIMKMWWDKPTGSVWRISQSQCEEYQELINN